MSEEIIEELPEPVDPDIPCPFCGQTGLILVDWDEGGNEVFEPCKECGGDGLYLPVG